VSKGKLLPLRAAPHVRDVATSARQQLAAEDDAALVRAAQAGERLAFEELYRRHVQLVYARLTRLIGWSPEREDLIQQVFWKFHLALGRYRGDAPVAAFLHGIVVHVAYEALRKRRNAMRKLEDHELDQLVAPDATPEARARQREQLARVFALLERLKPKKRIAFVLHVIEGLPLTEVAELTDSQPRAVGQRVAYARSELLQMLQREGEER
jgi:RNA polymerase sigma-70 factor, ECF subfamily